MSFLNKTIAAAALAGTLVIGGFSSYHSTDSTEVGVRTKKFNLFGKAGVEDKVYQPGSTYFFLPIINEWNTFDTRLTIVEMKGKGAGELAFKTVEGNDLHLDLVFTYRVNPKKVKYIREYVAANDEELREKVFKTVARSRTRDFFGESTTQQFYNAEERNAAAEKAKSGLQEILEPYGVIVEKVGLMDYRFNDGYERVIKEKKIAEAHTAEIEAQILAQGEMNKKLLNDAAGTVNELRARIDGAYSNTVAQADAYLDQKRFLAAAITREGQNSAETISKQREAMASAGGETQVKMRLVENLKGKRIIMLPIGDGTGAMNLQTLNMNDLLRMYGVQSLSEKK
ncbi:MAG TPA: SPFH domain-containing protein [Candidatus Nanoarchaeia archaeon]|nr:SPFH domain-containing protein [Candidatus Nanoarchaeia archaeon]